MKKPSLIIVISLICIFISCTMSSCVPEAETTTLTVTQEPSTVLLTTTTTTTVVDESTFIQMREVEVKTALVSRLQNMATSNEAKEYVLVVVERNFQYMNAAAFEDYWELDIRQLEESYDLIQDAAWFQVEDLEYFWEVHWGGGKIKWQMLSDGSFIEIGSMIEADIMKLNDEGVLF